MDIRKEEERREECRRRGDSMRIELANSVARVLIVFRSSLLPFRHTEDHTPTTGCPSFAQV